MWVLEKSKPYKSFRTSLSIQESFVHLDLYNFDFLVSIALGASSHEDAVDHFCYCQLSLFLLLRCWKTVPTNNLPGHTEMKSRRALTRSTLFDNSMNVEKCATCLWWLHFICCRTWAEMLLFKFCQ